MLYWFVDRYWWFVLSLWLVMALALPGLRLVFWRLRQGWPVPALSRRQKMRRPPGLLLGLALVSAWVLCGCGTVPCLAPTRLQVPAALLTPPAPPVLLTPGLGLRMPGPITPPTLNLAPLTGSGSSN